ncbi:hypothetical protein B0T16DRAFT_431796 [Cercophora newfieldiana]|uniref:Uncharacterized protein n=1 Tax=Cercophora newfieldiana TaxID=92897 RepID=A0AA39XR40_9PEZI|nr:hypothetical protein B0T16DRAFT_431796 [Cercophora newfieldiana]
MSPFFTSGAGAGWLESRGDMTSFGQSRNINVSGNGLFQSSTNQTFNQFNQQQNRFVFAAAKSIRTSTIILAVFNTIAAFATAVGILFDSYYRKKRNDKNFRFRQHGFTFVPEAEVYPLVLSFCIVVQSITFAVAQSTGLEQLWGTGCTTLAQLMLPAVFLAPYTQLVFGIEMAARALRKRDQPFAPRAKWDVTICLTVIGILCLINFLVANFDRSDNFCLLSLFWFVAHYVKGCFALLVGITSTLMICVGIVFMKLTRSIKVEVTARVSASRMVYYMALAILSNGFMIPFFYAMVFVEPEGRGGNALNLAMVASVVANVSGLMTGGLYLFLKSNTLSTIGPRDKVGEYEKRRLKYKIRRAEDDDFDGHMLDHVRGPKGLRRMNSDASLISNEKEEEIWDEPVPNPLRSHSVYPMNGMPRAPEPAKFSMSSAFGHMRKKSYSLFPGSDRTKSYAPSAKSFALSTKSSVALLPATTYSPNSNIANLKPPPSMKALTSGRHRRDSSLVSTATVQIGLRFSNVNDMPPVVVKNTEVADTKVYHLDCPKLRAQGEGSPRSGRPTALVSPIRDSTAEKDDDTLVEDAAPRRSPRMKTLPPVPAGGAPIQIETDDESDYESDYEDEKGEITLRPKVYDPRSPTKTRLASPKGVGFTMLTNSATSKPSGSTTPPPKAAGAKSDWI